MVGIDVRQEKLDLAKRLGATFTVDASAEAPAAAVQRLGGADVAVALSVNPTAIEQAHASLRPGGRLVLVSLPKAGELSVPIFSTVLKGISVIGSIVGTRQDLREVFELHAAGRTRVIAETRTLEQVNESSTRSSPATSPPAWSSASEARGDQPRSPGGLRPGRRRTARDRVPLTGPGLPTLSGDRRACLASG